MEHLILHQNSTSLWKDLVSDAASNCSIELSEELESYLVFLLMRFTKDASIAKKIVALDFLNAQKETGLQQTQKLRDVGDLCLLFSGLFPERAIKRQLRVSYYVKIGQSAYGNLAQCDNNSLADLFNNLKERFVPLMDVLQTIRRYDPEQELEPIFAEELWSDTGSKSALDILKKYTNNQNFIFNNIDYIVKN